MDLVLEEVDSEFDNTSSLLSEKIYDWMIAFEAPENISDYSRSRLLIGIRHLPERLASSLNGF